MPSHYDDESEAQRELRAYRERLARQTLSKEARYEDAWPPYGPEYGGGPTLPDYLARRGEPRHPVTTFGKMPHPFSEVAPPQLTPNKPTTGGPGVDPSYRAPTPASRRPDAPWWMQARSLAPPPDGPPFVGPPMPARGSGIPRGDSPMSEILDHRGVGAPIPDISPNSPHLYPEPSEPRLRHKSQSWLRKHLAGEGRDFPTDPAEQIEAFRYERSPEGRMARAERQAKAETGASLSDAAHAPSGKADAWQTLREGVMTRSPSIAPGQRITAKDLHEKKREKGGTRRIQAQFRDRMFFDPATGMRVERAPGESKKDFLKRKDGALKNAQGLAEDKAAALMDIDAREAAAEGAMGALGYKAGPDKDVNRLVAAAREEEAKRAKDEATIAFYEANYPGIVIPPGTDPAAVPFIVREFERKEEERRELIEKEEEEEQKAKEAKFLQDLHAMTSAAIPKWELGQQGPEGSTMDDMNTLLEKARAAGNYSPAAISSAMNMMRQNEGIKRQAEVQQRQERERIEAEETAKRVAKADAFNTAATQVATDLDVTLKSLQSVSSELQPIARGTFSRPGKKDAPGSASFKELVSGDDERVGDQIERVGELVESVDLAHEEYMASVARLHSMGLLTPEDQQAYERLQRKILGVSPDVMEGLRGQGLHGAVGQGELGLWQDPPALSYGEEAMEYLRTGNTPDEIHQMVLSGEIPLPEEMPFVVRNGKLEPNREELDPETRGLMINPTDYSKAEAEAMETYNKWLQESGGKVSPARVDEHAMNLWGTYKELQRSIRNLSGRIKAHQARSPAQAVPVSQREVEALVPESLGGPQPLPFGPSPRFDQG